MPKIRTSRTAAKRFTITKSGKVKFKHAYARHMFSAKSPKQKAHLRTTGVLGKADAKRVQAMMPYA
ncbi:MAG TPA: 50S ribosomal protein L35 [Candidatus Binataceae bacterium]|jgi:large subunit ribosomal protein L35|nr:50S ribosomal protein L35 [Candidatus Binataceae bacterium]